MRTAALLLSILALAGTPARANEVAYEPVVEVAARGGDRLVEAAAVAMPSGRPVFGPFRVLDESRAALVGATDEATPAQFSELLRAYPKIAVLELVEVPGTEDDRANLTLGRMIRARGISTHAPDGGSVRSGGVELFLAGLRHTAAAGAEFAVHAWADEDGREATAYAPDAPENRAYITYYREMGMSADQAAAFYAMTNSVPHAQAKWLSAAEMSRWVSLN